MRQYGNALAAMSNEAVEYVRGIPVVKTFGQSVFSFKNSKPRLTNTRSGFLPTTKDMRLPMMLYTAAINGVFAFLILGAFWFTNGTVTSEFFRKSIVLHNHNACYIGHAHKNYVYERGGHGYQRRYRKN